MRSLITQIFQDIRYAVRLLAKNPGFTAIVVFTLALGIGANAAIFSVTDKVLLQSLPVQDPDQLVVLSAYDPKEGPGTESTFSYAMYQDLRDRNDVFSGVITRGSAQMNVSYADQNERVRGELVSGNFFEVLGVRPWAGRLFTQEDDRTPGAHPVAVLSYQYWDRRFAKDPNIIGKTLQNLRAVDTGFGKENVLFASLNPALNGYSAERSLNFYDELLARTRALPGVTAATLASDTPISGGWDQLGLVIEGYKPREGERTSSEVTVVSNDYFKVLGVPLLTGRDFNDQDRLGTPKVVILNEKMARHFFGTIDVLGKRIGLEDVPDMTIVGVVKDAQYVNLRRDIRRHFYMPVAQQKQLTMLVGVGVLIGLGASVAFGRFIGSLLFGVEPTNSLTLAIVSLGLIAVALLACYLPARRATKVDPLEALRYE